MSHPDPCYDPDNSYEDDMIEREEVYEMDGVECGHEDNYDDYNDFHEGYDDSFDDSMDGDFDSAMRDAGFGTDEDYGCFGGEDY